MYYTSNVSFPRQPTANVGYIGKELTSRDVIWEPYTMNTYVFPHMQFTFNVITGPCPQRVEIVLRYTTVFSGLRIVK